MNRESFVFHREWYDAIKELDDSVRFEIYDAIVAEAFGLEEKKLSPLAQMAMNFIRQRLDSDKKKYESICLRNSVNGAKGGRPKKTQENPNNPENPMGILETQENPNNPKKPKKADIDIQDTKVSMSIYNESKDSIKEKDSKESKKKETVYTPEYEKDFALYGRKGSKMKGFERWKQLSEEDKVKMRQHIPYYLQSNERKYLKDFEGYIHQRMFESPVYQGSNIIYDPAQGEQPEDYHPLTDVGQIWDETKKCLIVFNGDIDNLNDGYTSDNRPDGATVAWGMYSWKWNKAKKQWIQ